MPHDETRDNTHQVNPGYAAFQIARALTTSEKHDDPAVRESARVKAEKWVGVLEGLLSGQLAVGSRQPIANVPVWATPEVMTGGFSTGNLLAGGELRPHETDLAARIGAGTSEDARQKLNAYFLSDTGLAELSERLRSGCYQIEVPEEAALLVVAWMLENGRTEVAREIVDAVAPHFASLRFYPEPAERAVTFGARIFLESVGTVIERLRRIEPSRDILAQREAIEVWTPLYEKMIGLFLETVSGDEPTIAPDAEGRWTSAESKRFHVVGGWPCLSYPADWCDRARAVVASIEHARTTNNRCGRPKKPGDSFARLVGYLRKCSDFPASLTGREVGMIRLILARHVARRGAPGSPLCEAIHARQLSQVAKPMHHQIATILAQRLAMYAADAGLDDTEHVLLPITRKEALAAVVPEGSQITASIARKVERCLCDTAEVLVERGIITSGDTLAKVVPQLTAGLRGEAFADPKLRVLYAATYRAFRRRRSLLLLDLEQQVRIEELPWVAAMERHRRSDPTARDLSRQTLKEVAALTLRTFPQAIIPNKLLQEFRALAKGGELELPFVEELAADIFMDDFAPKFTQAAKRAAAFVEETLYARYYEVDCATLLSLPATKPEPRRWPWLQREAPSNPFTQIAIKRAAAEEGKRWDVARNGMIIEQSQILTTHNLALLLGTLGLEDDLRDSLRGMAERCFRWICRRHQDKSMDWHAKLIVLKQTAYAWRQMIFFLSRLPHNEIGEFIGWAEIHFAEQPADFRSRFTPALRGLVEAHEGKPIAEPAKRFFGWTQKRHWLLGEDKRTEA